MKTILITAAVLVSIFMIAVCCGKIVIPDEPEYKSFQYLETNYGILIPPEGIAVLNDNVKKMKNQNEDMKKAIEKHNEGGLVK